MTLAIALSISAYSPCLGQRADLDAEAVSKAVETEMRTQRIVGTAIGIIRNGRVVFVRGYGSANIESATPVTSDTIFNWASNSKPLIAIAALQLVQEGTADSCVRDHSRLADLISFASKPFEMTIPS